MATGPYPSGVSMRPIRVEGAWCGGGYSTRIVGYRAIIRMSDHSEVACCEGPHGHKRQANLISCVTAKVAELNNAAGIPEAAQ